MTNNSIGTKNRDNRDTPRFVLSRFKTGQKGQKRFVPIKSGHTDTASCVPVPNESFFANREISAEDQHHQGLKEIGTKGQDTPPLKGVFVLSRFFVPDTHVTHEQGNPGGCPGFPPPLSRRADDNRAGKKKAERKNNMKWTISLKIANQDRAFEDDWKNLHVIVERKRRYHLAYSPAQKRFVESPDFNRFETNQEPSEILCAIRDYFEPPTKSEDF